MFFFYVFHPILSVRPRIYNGEGAEIDYKGFPRFFLTIGRKLFLLDLKFFAFLIFYTIICSPMGKVVSTLYVAYYMSTITCRPWELLYVAHGKTSVYK